MKRQRNSQSAGQAESLFGDLSVVEALSHSETIALPANDSLEKIREDLERSPACGVCKAGMPIVFGVGPERAELMLVGEGPGIDDQPSQQPFQGQAGVLLTRMLAAINLARQECYLCNVVKCIPPGERVFSVEEVEDCRPILLRQILAVQPRVIVALGALAAQTLLRSKKTISDLRGRSYEFRLNDAEMIIVPTFNPAYLLRVAEKKREAWEDLKLVRALLQS
ncbi:MAG TPA: uracil-DNA glycosylase [Blastocatellia bacterium]|nr:uracil-DNA glycosylase [Blastocatellia bacterium]HMY72842.1 uracil-DNA glycosylase [Blastocatellia bacterium]HMZ20866.1 uracil-DNA glycosylase [Blastocatellia bacterium]HNG31242.1 uracil-DNA glycosylase [Blastocatellia bacterium]